MNNSATRTASSLMQYFLRALGATAVYNFLFIFFRVVEVSVFTNSFGAAQYGVWLTLMSLVSFLALADFGLNSSAEQRMISAVASGAPGRAMAALVLSMTLAGASLAMFGAVICAVAYFLGSVFTSTQNGIDSVPSIVFLLSLHTSFTVLRGFLLSVLKADKRYAFSMCALAVTEITQSLTVLLCLLKGVSPLELAGVYAVTSTTIFLLLVYAAHRAVYWFEFCSFPDWRSCGRDLLGPAAGYSAAAFGQLLSLQGVRLAAALVLGPVEVVEFAAHRQIARISMLFLTFLNPITIETTRVHASDDFDSFKNLTLKGTQLCVWGFASLNVMILIASPLVFRLWLGGKVEFNLVFMVTIVLTTLTEGLWRVLGAPAQALNRHALFSKLYLFAMCLMLPFSALGGYLFGLAGVGLSLFLAELTTFSAAAKAGSSVLRMATGRFLVEAVKPPTWALSSLRRRLGC